MKRVTSLLLLIVLSATALVAQNVTNGVLTSWGDANGAIRIPDGVTEIAANCFFSPGEEDPDGWGATDPVSNTAITSVDLNGVIIVGDNAFKGCSGIKTLKASNLETIGRESFEGCTALTSLELPAIKRIGEKAFENATALETLSMGNSLASIVKNPLQHTLALQTITIEEGCANYFATQGAIISRADGVLTSLGGGVKEISLGEECKAIGDDAIYNCETLERVELTHVKEIGENAFVNSFSLAKLCVPRLERIKSHWMSFSGVGALRVVDIHLSESVSGFEALWPNKETTTVYVANEAVKTELSAKLSRCNFVIGAPEGTLQRYRVTYSCNEGGQLEVWTTGVQDVNSGDMLVKHAQVSFKAIPRYEMRIKEWRINDQVVTEGLEGDPLVSQTYVISDLTADVKVEVLFESRPSGYDVFFRSRAPQMGTLTCSLDDGTEVKSGGRVPAGSMLNFTATPKAGYRVADWFEEVVEGQYKPIAGQNGQATYRCEAREMLETQVDFDRMEGHYIVRFSSFNDNTGTLTATADGEPIVSGCAIKGGSKLIFTAHPAEGYVVDEWQHNRQLIPGYRELTYTIESLEEDLEINMVCSEPADIDHKPIISNGVLHKWQPVGDAVLPAEVTYIAPLAFEGANEMASLTLNDKVHAIGDRAFLFCTALKQFIVPEGNNSFSTIDGVLYNKDKTQLIAYPAGISESTYTLGAHVVSIQSGAFLTPIFLRSVEVAEGNKSLMSVDGVLYTADYSQLLFFPAGNRTAVEDKLVLPEGVKEITRLALAYQPTLKEVTLPGSLTKIEPMAMSYNAAMKSFVWAEGVTPQVVSVGDSAFYYDRSLESIPYMASCTSFGKAAFGLATGLKEVHIPAECMIAANSFVGCQTIKAVYSYSVEPPVIDASTFADIVYLDEATLYVQKGAKEAYSKAKGWSIFNKIEEQKNLSVAPIDGLTLSLYPNPTEDFLHIAGATADSPIMLYDLTGRLVDTTRTDATGSAELYLGDYLAGTYVVRIAGAERLVVKQ